MKTPLFYAVVTVVAAYVSTTFAFLFFSIPVIGAFVAPVLLFLTEAVTYPLTLFVTFVHESGHALAALATGGSVTGMGIGLRGNGLTTTLTSGWFSRFAVLNAGYLAGIAYGTFALLWANRSGDPTRLLKGTAIMVAACTLLFAVFAYGPSTGNLTVWMRFYAAIVGATLSVALWTFAKKVKDSTILEYGVNLLAVACLFRSFGDIVNVFVISSGRLTDNDATSLGNLTGIPGPFWAVAWGAASLFIIWKAFNHLKGSHIGK